ncbi:hypothetical protein KSP39_PZI009313 [Platanthera zijinensis]|uniref:Uncharacterized protein n=1 Tax=Platanthera zijinensis TaxID=2320716 RepID=A0AAP0BL69_9ASPA
MIFPTLSSAFSRSNGGPNFNNDLASDRVILHYIRTGSIPPPLSNIPTSPIPVPPTPPSKPTLLPTSDDDDDLQTYIQFKQFMKMKQRYSHASSPTSIPATPSPSHSPDPFGGSFAQDPYEGLDLLDS